ncbi:hypothetical protein CBL_12275 [Carabus blaptoides fortunei]
MAEVDGTRVTPAVVMLTNQGDGRMAGRVLCDTAGSVDETKFSCRNETGLLEHHVYTEVTDKWTPLDIQSPHHYPVPASPRVFDSVMVPIPLPAAHHYPADIPLVQSPLPADLTP